MSAVRKAFLRSSLADPTFAGADELEQVLNFGQWRQLLFDPGKRIGNGQAVAEENFVSLTERDLRVFGNRIAFHADFVDGARFGRISVGQHERRDVLDNFRAAADHGHFAHAAELVDRNHPADDSVVFDGHVTRKGADVGHNDVIAEAIVMGDVAVSQDVVIRANRCHFAVAGRAVDGDTFAEGIVVANFGSCDAALPFQILRLKADAGEGEDFVAASEFGMAIDNDMRMQAATGAQCYVFANRAIWSDFAIRANLCFGMNDRRRVDHRLEMGIPAVIIR